MAVLHEPLLSDGKPRCSICVQEYAVLQHVPLRLVAEKGNVKLWLCPRCRRLYKTDLMVEIRKES